MSRYIFITGGVVSSLGKGILSSSLGLLLSKRGLSIAMVKLDPYLNYDPGTMSPYQHGEVFVTDDGAETDLDLGHYERFTSLNLTRDSTTTTGRIYQSIISREREGGYFGQTVQVVPHVTDAIKQAFTKLESPDIDVILVELGGTVGDIEGTPYLEAFRQFRLERRACDTLCLHLVLTPFLSTSQECKTRPAQHSTQRLRQLGLQPDFLLCRTQEELSAEIHRKLALMCTVTEKSVIDVIDAPHTVYEVPLLLHESGLDEQVCERFRLQTPPADLTSWRNFVSKLTSATQTVTIALVGKYASLPDNYKSVYEALIHATAQHNLRLNMLSIEAESVNSDNADVVFMGVQGILVPGGFGYRGAEGKIAAINYARQTNTPFLGLCYGLQCAVIEYARNVCGIPQAFSGEWRDTIDHVDDSQELISLIDEQRQVTRVGGTMRLGLQPAIIEPETKTYAIYGCKAIQERHRHRYEVNPDWVERLTANGLTIAARHPDSGLVEVIELNSHPFFIATQAHPEFRSRPTQPHPLFSSFVAACADK